MLAETGTFTLKGWTTASNYISWGRGMMHMAPCRAGALPMHCHVLHAGQIGFGYDMGAVAEAENSQVHAGHSLEVRGNFCGILSQCIYCHRFVPVSDTRSRTVYGVQLCQAWRCVATSVASLPDVFTVTDVFLSQMRGPEQCCDKVCSYAKAWHKHMSEQPSSERLVCAPCFCRSLMQQVLRWRGGGMSLTGSIRFGTRYFC